MCWNVTLSDGKTTCPWKHTKTTGKVESCPGEIQPATRDLEIGEIQVGDQVMNGDNCGQVVSLSCDVCENPLAKTTADMCWNVTLSDGKTTCPWKHTKTTRKVESCPGEIQPATRDLEIGEIQVGDHVMNGDNC